jgi:cell wall-associated NlpC family hydrolase
MKPFFDTPEKISALQFHAALWLGTPFMPNAAERGAGVSCQTLVGALYRECGVIGADFAVPIGPMDWSHANKRSLIADYMVSRADFLSVPAGPGLPLMAQPGDMLGFKIGGCLHHCGLVLAVDGQFIHCVRGRSTFLSNVRDATYFSRLEKIWRPLQS